VGRNADIAIRIVTSGVNTAKTQLGKLNSKISGMSTFAKGAALAVGVALAQGVKAAFKEFVAFDDAMTQSLAIMKTTVEQQEAMSNAAREVATQFRVSNKDAADSFFFLASAGLDAEQSVAALPQVTKFAQAGMFDMATATDLATDAQSALGLTVKDAEANLTNLTRVTDVLVKANQLANASVQQFSEALTTKSGAALKVVNKDIEEGVAVLAAFADRGVKGAEAGEKLNQVLRDIPRATAKNSEEFKKLGLEMFDSEGNMKNVADVVEQLDAVLGPMSDEMKAATLDQLGLNRGVADAIKILSGSTEQIREYEAALRSSGGATDEVAENQMGSLAAKIDIMKSNFAELGLVIMEKFAPTIEKVVEFTTKLVSILSDTIEVTEEEKKAFQETAKTYSLYGVNVQKNTSYIEKFTDTRKEEIDHNAFLMEQYGMLRYAQMAAADAQEDHRTEVEEYNATVGNTMPVIEEAIQKTKEQIEADKEAAEAKRNLALPTINAVISAMENLNDIYEEQNDLLEKQENAQIKVAKAQIAERKAEEKLEKAKQRLNDVSGEGAKITDEEALAIARQQQRVQELTDIEDKSEIQKLELAVAINKLNELQEESIGLSQVEERAIRDIEKAEADLEKAKQKTIELQERLNKATQEYNDATAKTPSNLMKIAMAKKELDDALKEQAALGTFTEALQQMVDMGLGSFDNLRNGYMNMLNDIRSGGSGASSGGGGGSDTGGGGDVFDNEGNLDPEKAIPPVDTGLSDFDRRNRGHVPSGNMTTVNLSMTGLAMTQVEVTEAVAEVIRRARNEGLDIG
tara:strand:- start:138 stop:2546 length:2409 start_codon:yes stop_codon:yes gene_type:complete